MVLMISALTKGQVLNSGFEILDIIDLKELEAKGIWALHKKSRAQVFHILNDDKENLFSFTFKTIPEDSTGAAHILEHSVLCGSENYPLKDAFLVLAQGSLNTYLNAWTFPDKTIYPASSTNEQDYFNLMAVYGDAVFRPLISEWTFLQEGRRLEFDKADASRPSGLKITGVVYNEMKGAYSSLDAYAGFWATKSVLPDTPYSFDSGGDPDHIYDLSWEGLKTFHKSRYSPANCLIFLAGNIPTEKQLAFLDDNYFSSIPQGKAAPLIPMAERWKEHRKFTIPCPASEQKSTVFLSYLCGSSTNTEETIDLAALAETLLGHDGSPLTRALIDSGLGEDLSPVSGFEGDLLETVFTAGLRGVEAKNYGKVEALISGELKRLVKEGIPKQELEAMLLAMEFSHREIRRAGGPFSLVWLRRSMRAWLHGNKPWDSLLFEPLFDGLKQRLAANPLYLEGLIQKYLLDNPHRAMVIIEPQKGFLEKKEAALAEQLKQKESSLSHEEKQLLNRKNQELIQIQEQPDSLEALAAIPHLSRKDLSPDIEVIPREYLEAGSVPVLQHSLYTNGISYFDLAFPVDNLEAEDYQWLPFFSRASISCGLPGMDYGQVSSLLARTVGGFHALVQTGSRVPGSSKAAAFPSGILDLRGRDWIVFRLKALDEKSGASLDLARRLITEADFSDHKRVRDLALELKNEMNSSLAPSGHNFASLRSGRSITRSRNNDEIWSGIEQLKFIHKISALEPKELSSRLSMIREKLVKSGLIINYTCNASALKNGLKNIAANFGSFGSPRPRKDREPGTYADRSAAGLVDFPSAEVFASPSLQIGFASTVLPVVLGAGQGRARYQSSELVLSHLLSTGALWEEIRMKGGAYGAFAQPDIIEETFSLSTYRDPNPLASLEVFKLILNNYIGYKDNLDKTVIGAYSRETRPRTAAEKGLADFSRLLYGIEDNQRKARLEALIDTKEGDLKEILRILAAANPPCPVIITGVKDAEKAAKALGVEVQALPA